MKQQHIIQPKLRFPEFDGDWNSIKLGDLMTFKNGVNASKENYGFGYKFINVLDIINNNIITNDLIIGEVNITDKEFEKNIVQYGDILFQRSSETREEVGQSNVYLDELPATFGGFVIRGKSISKYNSLYLHYLLKTSKARLEITTKSGGSTRFNVGQETLSNVIIKISPFLPEQQKIADYLSTIDTKMNLLEEKKAQLALYKKAMMQKLFAQEIRFKDDNGNDFPEWEEKKLGEIGDLYQPKTISQNDLSKEGYLVYGANGVIGRYYEFNHEHEQIAITCRGNTCGTINYTHPKSWITGNAMVLNLDKNFDVSKRFVYYKLCFDNLDYLITGSGQPQITSDIKYHKIQIPSLPEQQKIADFLSAIDASIEKVNEQISQTQSFKKAMLQQMFV